MNRTVNGVVGLAVVVAGVWVSRTAFAADRIIRRGTTRPAASESRARPINPAELPVVEIDEAHNIMAEPGQQPKPDAEPAVQLFYETSPTPGLVLDTSAYTFKPPAGTDPAAFEINAVAVKVDDAKYYCDWSPAKRRKVALTAETLRLPRRPQPGVPAFSRFEAGKRYMIAIGQLTEVGAESKFVRIWTGIVNVKGGGE